jgi:hypothetical protein
MALVHKTLWESVRELVLEQYRGSPNLLGLIRAVVEECAQPIEDSATALQDVLNVDSAIGEWLDIIGKMVGVKRNDGESDDDFRKRVIVNSMENDAGTPNNVIDVAKELSGDPAPQYLDEVPATFFVYTPNGKALTLSQVDKLAPAGVLGLPGAAIRLGNGGFLQNAGGKKFLSVIPNAEWKLEALLIESSGLHIVTDSGKRIRIVAEQSRRANA